jgi:tetratricopeptide (TPR) repeat protein
MSMEAQRIRRAVDACRDGRFTDAVAALAPLAGRRDATGRLARRHLGNAHRMAGQAALRSRSLEQAELHLRRAESLLGPLPSVSEALADTYAAGGRFDLAAAEIERAISAAGNGDPAGWRKLAMARWRAGQREEAHAAIQAGLRRLGENAELHVQRGLFLSAENRLAEAREAFTRAVEADGECAEAHRCLGLADAAAGRHGQAVESLQRWADLSPRQAMPAYLLSLAARAARQRGDAATVHWTNLCGPGAPLREIAAAGAADPPPAAPPPELVEATLKAYEGVSPASLKSQDKRQLESLLASLLRAMAGGSPAPELAGCCAETLELLGRDEEALPHAEAAAKTESSPRPQVRAGRLLAKLGRRRDAVQYLEQAVRQGADWPDVHCLLAECLVAAGRMSDARQHLGRALRQNPALRQAKGLSKRLAA